MDSFSRLKTFLAQLPTGTVTDSTIIKSLLPECWSEFEDAYSEAMKEWKLSRMEGLEWNSPELSFKIERHGGIAIGATRAEMQHWVVDVEKRTATCGIHGYRQLKPRDEPFHVGPLVDELLQAIAFAKEDRRIRWLNGRREVRVLISSFITGNYNATRKGRRERFQEEFDRRIAEAGWTKLPSRKNVYGRSG